jgi:RNA recognition motif-containing protein
MSRGGTNVYVGRIADRTRERDLEDLFGKYGRIRNIILKRGYGFVVIYPQIGRNSLILSI